MEVVVHPVESRTLEHQGKQIHFLLCTQLFHVEQMLQDLHPGPSNQQSRFTSTPPTDPSQQLPRLGNKRSVPFTLDDMSITFP